MMTFAPQILGIVIAGALRAFREWRPSKAWTLRDEGVERLRDDVHFRASDWPGWRPSDPFVRDREDARKEPLVMDEHFIGLQPMRGEHADEQKANAERNELYVFASDKRGWRWTVGKRRRMPPKHT